MKTFKLLIMGITTSLLMSCGGKGKYDSFDEYPVRPGNLTEMSYSKDSTLFHLWAPTADEVRVMLYKEGSKSPMKESIVMTPDEEGTWSTCIKRDLKGMFYTFNVKVNDKWLGAVPGINAKATGVNGKRGAIIDLAATNPKGWESDKRPTLNDFSDVTIYEMHHRDFSIDSTSHLKNKGKFLALTETGTSNSAGLATGIDHLKELGVTHVHILPSFDYASVDETKLLDNVYNWGYDPVNYNVPDGSYSTDPYNPESRIREFKQMVMALHKAGIRVVLDVVYNHTYSLESSSFEKTVPGYFYRKDKDGNWGNASGCGNETASNRPMMRKYMIESVLYWMNEYHIDGFRFDLMGVHDIKTMNAIREVVNKVDKSILIYGEGWAAGQPQMPSDSLAMKQNTKRMPGVAAFSDELRDALRGPFSNDKEGAFLAGKSGSEESLKFGIVGAINHPEVDYQKVNYSKEAWATEPTQMISYVSCHDDMCLVDRLKSSMKNLRTNELIKLDKLAQTVVFTSQAIPFMLSGEEVLRNKKGVHNSYNSPDEINKIDWNNKTKYKELFDYYCALIQLRKDHKSFRLGNAEAVRKHLHFLPVEENCLVAYQLKDVEEDAWKDIIVAFNSSKKAAKVTVPNGKYVVVCENGFINQKGIRSVSTAQIDIAPQSALIMHKVK